MLRVAASCIICAGGSALCATWRGSVHAVHIPLYQQVHDDVCGSQDIVTAFTWLWWVLIMMRMVKGQGAAGISSKLGVAVLGYQSEEESNT
jgi:hypothetical protein